MPNLNRVMLMGNLTRDPELRYLPSNVPVVGFSLAINRNWTDKQGEKQEEVAFIDCEAFAKTAELINQYMRKGRPLYVEGRLKLDQWQDKEGGKRSKLKVVVENFQFIDSRGGGAGGGGEGGDVAGDNGGSSRGPAAPRGGSSGPGPNRSSPPAGGSPSAGDPHQPVGEEDIPF